MSTNGTTHKLEWIRVGDLQPWTRCQRKLDERRAATIAAEFDPDKFGIPLVMARGRRRLVVDGQHRVAALRILEWDDQLIECEIHKGLTDAQAADLFIGRNTTVRVPAVPRFKAAVVAGNPDAIAINEMVESFGLAVAHNGNNAISAVKALERVYRPVSTNGPFPKALHSTLSVMAGAWGATHETMQGALIDGIGRVFVTYGDLVDLNTARHKLARIPGGASGLIGDARGLRRLVGGTLTDGIAALVVTAYNKGRRSQKLPKWRGVKSSVLLED